MPLKSAMWSARGPMESAGRNVSPPTRSMTITSMKANNASFVGSVPTETGVTFLAANLPASISTNIIGTNLATNIFNPKIRFQKPVFALNPAKAEPLLPAVEVAAYSICENPCGTEPIVEAAAPGTYTAIAETTSIMMPEKSDAAAVSLISVGPIFFPKYSGVLPIISPAKNTVIRANNNRVYIPDPTPPKISSPSCMSKSSMNPVMGILLSCILFTAPQDVTVVTTENIGEAPPKNLVSLPSLGMSLADMLVTAAPFANAGFGAVS